MCVCAEILKSLVNPFSRFRIEIIMGRSCFLVAFLVTSFLILSSSHGCGRKLLKSYESEEYATVVLEGSGRDDSREMMELDYEYAEPNNNPKSGLLFTPPPPPPLPPTPTP